MEKRIATFISKIFNPLIFTVLFFLIIFNLQFYFSTAIPQNAKWMILGLVFITTFIVPGLTSITFGMMLKNKLALARKDERIIPLVMAAAFYLFTYHLLDRINLSPIFNLFILGMASLAVISVLIILVKNISIYMVAAGALTGAFVGLHLTLQVNLSFFILISLLLGGAIGFSRLAADKHQPREVYLGFVVGAAVMMGHYICL